MLLFPLQIVHFPNVKIKMLTEITVFNLYIDELFLLPSSLQSKFPIRMEQPKPANRFFGYGDTETNRKMKVMEAILKTRAAGASTVTKA